ncbi:hypothetical protein KAFR_0A05990 [Kazachstania africana CBS 2517]|uniref:Bms1-type G domain-containing protein n=1 Tax=Kazachstania africana (strain ATCC 22294 / BCRC 22015 / CBS 2517 / CECT 1963 / NBRC 1671 / NRRL Y-8276) TaxID=1071382 RepID=H2ANT4_KAZAF|nr:hypothetical protein KAFR_0A05990 [Kazachstania africana CBS 2517]CCF56034.1 hypothetical protein KAFR_0A05990 [Kazachstania africana CBS 2517]
MAGYSHRSSLKRGHKPFKSKHASKGALKRIHKGKVEKDIANNKQIKGTSKLQRKNKAKQLKVQKMMTSLESRKLFEGSNGAEKIVTIIPLTADVDSSDIVRKLMVSADLEMENLPFMSEEGNVASIRNYQIKKFKSTLKIIVPDMSNFLNILDCAKIADFVVFGLSGTSEVDQEFGEQIIRALELQGISSYIGVVPNLSKVHPKEKFQLDVKQSLESYFRHFFPNEDHVYNLEKPSDSLIVLRTLCQKLPRPVTWRDNRGYLVAENVDYNEISPEAGHLVVQGTVRGIGFHANRLVHVPGLGDFQVSRIEKISASQRKKTNPDELGLDLNNTFESNENRDDLEEYAPADLEMEEWSDAEDFAYDNLRSARYDDHGYIQRSDETDKSAEVPKGTSEYQAKWYLNDVIQPLSDEEVEEQEDMMSDDDLLEDEYQARDANFEDEEVNDENEDMFVELSPEEEERQLNEYRALEDEDREFPDEIELNPAESAIEGLKRYRGLKNLYNCMWDVDEKDPECPPEWKRLLRIGNYKYTRNRVLKEASKTAQVMAGDRVRIYIAFPKNLLEQIKDPQQVLFAIYGLLAHEHKNTMANFTLQRWEEYDKPVPAEEPLVVQYGIRRYTIQPLFSADANSSNNVHKFDKFLHPDTRSVATCIAPVDFTQSPAIFFKPSSSDVKGLELVGHGTFMNADHTRVLAKRAILTGHPFRFHRNVVTVRYMFFRPEDVEWFKSIPLFTKSGRSGFIKESLGTHGYFKATFDGKLSAQDVVAMSLFKRMWPKASSPWNNESY